MLTCLIRENMLDIQTRRVLSTYIVESRASIIGINILVWASLSHIGT